jgi:hypothetical protein
MNQPIRTQTCQSSPCNGQFIFFLRKMWKENKKVEKKNLYLEQENVFGFLLSLIFFSLFSFSLSSLKVIFFYILTTVNTFSRRLVVFPLSLFPISTFFFPSSLSRHPFFISYFFFCGHRPKPTNVNFFYFPLSL